MNNNLHASLLSLDKDNSDFNYRDSNTSIEYSKKVLGLRYFIFNPVSNDRKDKLCSTFQNNGKSLQNSKL